MGRIGGGKKTRVILEGAHKNRNNTVKIQEVMSIELFLQWNFG